MFIFKNELFKEFFILKNKVIKDSFFLQTIFGNLNYSDKESNKLKIVKFIKIFELYQILLISIIFLITNIKHEMKKKRYF